MEDALNNVAPANALKPGGRMLGFDIWRFWGMFLVLSTHNLLVLDTAVATVGANTAAPGILEEFIYPRSIQILGWCAVPMFLFTSGFFTLRRSPRENDWTKAKKDFVRYLLYYWKWLLLALIVFIAFPAVWAINHPFEGKTFFQNAMMVLSDFINTNLASNNITQPVAINWFIITLACLALLSPLLRPFFHSGNIRMIRIIVFALTLWSSVFYGIRMIGTWYVTANPDSVIGNFFAVLNPIQGNGWNWNNPFIPMFMLGGWFAVDTKAQEFLKKLHWGITIPILLALLLLQAAATHLSNVVGDPFEDWNILLSYGRGGWIFGFAMFVILAYKLNFVIKESSAIGRFTKNWSDDALGVMTVGWAFGPYMLSAIFQPIVTNIVQTFWDPASPVILSLVYYAFNIAYYIAVFVVVHLLKKVPVVRRMLMFGKEKLPTKTVVQA